MKKRGIIRKGMVLSLFVISCFGFGSNAYSGEWPPALGKKEITLARGPWVSADLVIFIAKDLLEKMGYSVKMPLLSTGPAYEALANGSADLFPNGFLPGQHAHVKKQYGKIDLLSHSYLPVTAGLIVPAYIPIDSIEDLKKAEVRQKFGGKIMGADPGTGTWILTEQAVKDYGLDYQVVPGSAATIYAVFKTAMEKGEWVVGMAWNPDAIWGKLSIKMLRDPKRIYPINTDFHVVRRGFRDDFPRATAFFCRFTLIPEVMGPYLALLGDKVPPQEVARKFIQDYPEEVYYWVYDLIENYPVPPSLK